MSRIPHIHSEPHPRLSRRKFTDTITSAINAYKHFASRKTGLVFSAFFVPAVIVWLIAPPTTPEGLEEEIIRAGFRPLKAPTSLYAPGTIYEVTKDGHFDPICEANSDSVKGRVRKAKTEAISSRQRNSSEDMFFFRLFDIVSSSIKSNERVSVSFILDNAYIEELSGEALGEVVAELTKRPGCDSVVRNHLRAGHQVCQASAVLSATTEYRVSKSDQRKIGNNLDDSARVLENAAKATIDGSFARQGERIVSGVDLNYGIRFASLCISLPGDKEAMPPPEPREFVGASVRM